MTSNLHLIRQKDNGKATVGELHFDPYPYHMCFILEPPWKDNQREISCIPPGEYPLRLRTEGGWHEKYRKRFAWHEGMVEVAEVPERDFILFHGGNTHYDTDGCLLPGIRTLPDDDGNPAVWSSTDAYRFIYRHLLNAINGNGKLIVHGVRSD